MKKINIACWSIGQHAIKNMLPAISECKDVNLSGIYTRNELSAEKYSKQYNCIHYISEYDLLNDVSIDAIYLSSPTGVHAEQILKCLDAGKSVLVEKTAFSSLVETKLVMRKAEQKKLIVMEAFMYRFHKQFQALNKLIKNKKYGNILKIDCEFGFPHLSRDDIRYKKELAGGAIFDAGAYTLSIVRYLLESKINLVWANIINLNEFEVDTGGYAIFSSGNIIANCTWFFGASYSNKVRIWCSDGHILCDKAFSKSPDFNTEILVEQNGIIVEKIITGCDNHFINMLSYFSKQVKIGNWEIESKEILSQAKIIEKIIKIGKK